MSSACRVHKTSVPRLFQVKQQRTALLKMKKIGTETGEGTRPKVYHVEDEAAAKMNENVPCGSDVK